MSDPHSVVCMKVVPKSEEIRVDEDTMRLVRAGVRSEFNPPDMNALELALGLKDRIGGRVSVLSMGPPDFEPYLRVALAMGADEAILLSSPDFAGADTLATTYTLARALELIPAVDLVLCGEESSDGATGQVPAGVAEWLGWPQLTLISAFEFDPERRVVRGRREISGGYELLEVDLPAVLSVKTASNEPRFMDYERKSWAMDEAAVTIWDGDAIDADPACIGLTGSPTIVTGLQQAESRERKREFLTGEPDQIARDLLERISHLL